MTRLAVRELTLSEAEGLMTMAANGAAGGGPISGVMMRADDACAYPIHGDVPILMGPEALVPVATSVASRTDPRYAEAYAEMAYYNDVAREWAEAIEQAPEPTGRATADLPASDDPVAEALRLVALARTDFEAEAASFPDPPELWLHLRYESMSLRDAYRHLSPLAGKQVLQVGGIGLDAVKFLFAGAAEVWLVTPMEGELEFARTLGRRCGVGARLNRVLGIAEELPFGDASFDAVYASGSLHHTSTEIALAECARVLRAGGRFACVEPWRAPGYRLGTRLLGKREPVHCRPLTTERARPLFDLFAEARLIHHGALTRYAMIALAKVGLELSIPIVRRVMAADDALASRVPRVRAAGSSVALLGTTR